jgi:Domain of unknown function (DUF4404)
MSLDSLGQLEARIQETHDLNPQQKAELLRLLADLKGAVAELSKTHEAHAHSLTGVTDTSAQEAAKEERPQHPLRIAMEELSTSVEAFEASHPALVNTVNKISMLLANMGI